MNHDSETEMRALDRRVAEEVMGWRWKPPGRENWNAWFVFEDGEWLFHAQEDWSPSTSIADAWTVVGRMVEKFGIAYCVELIQYNATEWEASFKADCYGKARTAPLAICRAALAAIEQEATQEGARGER